MLVASVFLVQTPMEVLRQSEVVRQVEDGARRGQMLFVGQWSSEYWSAVTGSPLPTRLG